MKTLLKRKVAFAALAVALLGGGAVAVAATTSSSSSGRQAYVNDVAKRLGIAPGAVSTAMQAAAIDRIEAAVAAGQISKAHGERLEQRIREGHGPLTGTRFGSGPHLGRPSAAVTYLGLSAATLRSERKSGKSLAQIAEATPGKSVAGLRAAIIARQRERLQAIVASGHITQDQADKRLARLASHIEALLTRKGHSARVGTL